MVLMALDHVRVYSGLRPGGPAPGIFFTRWITHFCAPAFIFLAGTSAFLYGRKSGSIRELSRFLLVRGAWLVLLELTFLRLAWTLNLEITQTMAGVIWAIGWSMILMAVLVRLPFAAIAAIGVVIVAGHNITDLFGGQLQPAPTGSRMTWMWQVLYFGGPVGGSDNGAVLFVLYSIVPWIGVMAAGYAFGGIMVMEPARRRRLCLQIGLGATALFLVLRAVNRYGNPSPWDSSRMPALLSFLNPSKYPASLDFLLMTLGPTIALVPLLEHGHGRVARTLTIFGRVPLFYYLLHIPLIHAVALLVSFFREGRINPWLFGNHPAMIGPPPEGYAWSLGLLYLVWAVVVALLYLPCRWFADLKSRRSEAWLSYL